MTVDIEADIRKALAHEQILIFEKFDQDDALKLGLLVRARAQGIGPVVVDIRAGETPLFYSAMLGTSPANSDWARRKRNLVNLTGKASYIIGLWAKQGNDIVKSMGLSERDYTPHGGCFPIRVRGADVVATLTVSGLPQREDHKLATDAIAEFLDVNLGDNAY